MSRILDNGGNVKKILIALGMAAFFAACDDSSSATDNTQNKAQDNARVQGDSSSSSAEGDGSVCGFSKADNVWKFSYSTWNYIDVYTWVDETTVEFKEYMNSYHMDKNDTTYTDVNRDEFYEKVLRECRLYNDIEKESSSESNETESSSSLKNLDDEVESSSSAAQSESEKSSDSQSSSSLAEGVVPHCKTETEDNCEYGMLVDDRDGQTYKTVKFGDQWWMAENLNYAYLQPTARWDSSSFCMDNLIENCSKFGRLYMWSAAMDSAGLLNENSKGCGDLKRCELIYPVRGICPDGWHLPSEEEFEILIDAVGGMFNAGKFLRSTNGWENDVYGCLDSYGFNVLSTGHWDGTGIDELAFYGRDNAIFWSSTQTDDIDNHYAVGFNVFSSNTVYLWAGPKSFAYAVRCIMD